MALIPKPFAVSEKIVRSVFAGDPSIFTDQDLNRQFDAIYETLNKTIDHLGLVREGWDCIFTMTLNASDNLDHKYSIGADSSGLPPVVYAKGVAFDIPLGDVTLLGVDPEVNTALYLIATKTLVTFSDDPTMSGISSSEYPTQLPSSDTYVYGDERLEVTRYGTLPVLTGEEEIIGVLVSEFSVSYAAETPKYRHNAVKFSDIFDALALSEPGSVNNNSAIDALLVILRKIQSFNNILAAPVSLSSGITAPVPGNGAYVDKINGLGVLRGFVFGTFDSEAGTSIGTLPNGWRPTNALEGYTHALASEDSTYHLIRYVISTTGVVHVYNSTAAACTGYLSLSSVPAFVLAV